MVLGARGPFRLPAVAVSHGWFQTAPFEWDAEGAVLRRAESYGDAQVTLTMSDAPGGVRVTASGPLSAPKRTVAAARVRRMLQLDADLTGFPDATAAVDPELARDLAAYGGGRLLAGPSLYEDVVKSICGTNTTWRQAVTTINRIAGLGAGDAFPAPADVLRAGEPWLRTNARVGYRAFSILGAARAAIDGTLAEIEADAAAADGERVYAQLQRLAGVGPATAGFLVLLMGHFDRPAVDSATIRAASRAWFDGRRPTPREVLARVAPAGEFAGLVLAWSTLRAWQRETGIAGLGGGT
jgi:3-methyladenine DNA glycosylase/8-oxoguanine DNA glycosylase